MEKDTRRILSVLILMAFLMSSLVVGTSTVAKEPLNPPTRGDVLEINDTMIITSSRSLGHVKIREGGSLIIQGAISVVMESLECKNDNGTSFQMIGDGPEDQNRAQLTVTGDPELEDFILHLEPERIFLQNAKIFAENRVDSSDLAKRGMNVVFNSMKDDFEINNTDIEIWAQNGEDGSSIGGVHQPGTSGAKATLTIQAMEGNDMVVSGSLIEVHGGSGGDAKIQNNEPGIGGFSHLVLQGEFVDISTSRVFSLGGQSGSIVSGTDLEKYGSAGGSARLDLISQREMNIDRSQVESEGGLRTDGKTGVTSFIYLTSEDDAIYMDSDKQGADRKLTLSQLLSDATLIEAPNGAFLHQVDLGDEKPSSQGDTIIFVYWWFSVNVRDNYGNPLKGAVISYTVGNDPTVITSPDNSWITGETGKLDLELESLIIEPGKPANTKSYTFLAVITGGATGNSDRIELDNQNEVALVGITLITVDLKMINGEEYKPGMVVGGEEAELEGVAFPAPNSKHDILSIQWYVDDTLIGDVTDISDPIMSPFSKWMVTWDTTEWPDGQYSLSFIAVDEAYEVRTEASVEVSQLAINHRPIVASAVVKDTVDEHNAEMGGTVESHVTKENPYLYINGTVWDRDAWSPYIDLGKIITRVKMVMTRSDGSVVYSKDLTSGYDELIKVNETGGWAYRFKVDTYVKLEVDGQSNYIFSEGVYKVQFLVEDDVPLASIPEDNFFMIDLEKDFYPVINLFLEGEDSSIDSDYEYDFPVFMVDTEKSHTMDVRFNFTKSYDEDDPDHDLHDSWLGLTYTLYVGSKSNIVVNAEKGISGFSYEFDVGDVGAGETEAFIIILEVEDSQGLKATNTFVVKVTHYPPEEEISLWETIFGVPPSVKFESRIFAFPAVFGLIIISYLGLVLVSTLMHKREQKKKFALLQKYREEEKSKKTSVVDDEILMGSGFIKSSTDYLEATGATKGKEEFQKELESKAAPKSAADTAKPAVAPLKSAAAPIPVAAPKPAAAPAQPAAAPAKPTVAAAKPAPPTPPAAAPAKPVVTPAPPAAPKPPTPPQG
ncbi:MAG: hypothetical protein KAH57_10465 [Thermoplasmata archaeon]|nr:hypothetical protein [Thermoplasmata archaeon]